MSDQIPSAQQPTPTLAERWETHRLSLMENYHTHPVAVAMRRMGTATIAVTLATSSMVATVISDKFPQSPFHNVLMAVLFLSCLFMFVGDIYRNFGGLLLQFSGVVMALVATAGLMGMFLPWQFTTACLVCAALCAAPLLDLMIRPKAGVPTATAAPTVAATTAGGA